MKRLALTFLLFAFATPLFSQKALGEKSFGLHAVFAVKPFSFPLAGGESKLLSSEPMAGVGFTFNVLGKDITPAGFLSGNLKIKNGAEENWNLNFTLGVIGWKGILTGLTYEFADQIHGIQGITIETLAFTLGFNFKTI